MKAGRTFLAGAIAVVFCLGLAGAAPARAAMPFALSGATVNEVIDTISGTAVDCADFPAASDTYVWNADVTSIHSVTFKGDLKTNAIFIAFLADTCTIGTNVTNTLEIPPGLTSIKTDKTTGLVTVTFTGAVPDFNSFNTANSLLPPFFDDLSLVVTYNPGKSASGGLAPGTGTIRVSGNANLCDLVTKGPPQCLFLDINIGTGTAYSCTCVTAPSESVLDITSLF